MMKKSNNQTGFTIIELMIATAVLSVILVLVTIVMVNIGTLYYKGINQSRVQDDARSIIDDATQNIKLNDQPPTPAVNVPGTHTQVVCAGSVRYAYVLGVQIGHQAPPPPPPSTPPVYNHVLWRDQDPTPGSCPTQVDPSVPAKGALDLTRSDSDLSSNDPTGMELIADNSRLTQFSMTPTAPSVVSVGVAYGDDDLLCNPSITIAAVNTCDTPSAMTSWANYSGGTGAVVCKGAKGEQFCSTAYLTTTAVLRLAGSAP